MISKRTIFIYNNLFFLFYLLYNVIPVYSTGNHLYLLVLYYFLYFCFFSSNVYYYACFRSFFNSSIYVSFLFYIPSFVFVDFILFLSFMPLFYLFLYQHTLKKITSQTG